MCFFVQRYTSIKESCWQWGASALMCQATCANLTGQCFTMVWRASLCQFFISTVHAPRSSHFSGQQLGEVHFLQFKLLPLRVRSLVLDVFGINLERTGQWFDTLPTTTAGMIKQWSYQVEVLPREILIIWKKTHGQSWAAVTLAGKRSLFCVYQDTFFLLFLWLRIKVVSQLNTILPTCIFLQHSC